MADIEAQCKKNGKEELHSFHQNTKRDSGESYVERYYRNGSSMWLCRIKMNHCAFVSVNCMSMSSFNIVSMAECECDDRLQKEGQSSRIVNCTRTKV